MNANKMKYEKRIRDLADFLLLNAFTLESSGLYCGKSGLSLCLFEAARYLKDEYIEEQAYDLLQQSLLSKTENIDFSNGLSGIGFVLKYLIVENMIDGDFFQLFGNNNEKINKGLWEVLNDKENIGTNFLDCCIYLELLKTKEAQVIQLKLLDKTECHITFLFKNIRRRPTRFSIMYVLNEWIHYLKIASYCKKYIPSRGIFDLYFDLYDAAILINDWNVGYYFSILGNRMKDRQIIGAAQHNMNVFFHVETEAFLPLNSYVDQLFRKSMYAAYQQECADKIYRNFFDCSSDKLEDWLYVSSPLKNNDIGFEKGVSRLALLLCYWRTLQEKQNVQRFKLLIN